MVKSGRSGTTKLVDTRGKVDDVSSSFRGWVGRRRKPSVKRFCIELGGSKQSDDGMGKVWWRSKDGSWELEAEGRKTCL